MSYQTQNGRFVNVDDAIFFPLGQATASVNGAPIECGERVTACLTLSVIAATGTTPTLDVTVQTRESQTAAWRTVGSFAQATGVSSERKSFPGLDRWVRAIATLGGTTPAFTFSVIGDLK